MFLFFCWAGGEEIFFCVYFFGDGKFRDAEIISKLHDFNFIIFIFIVLSVQGGRERFYRMFE